jgi:hypothetical protein
VPYSHVFQALPSRLKCKESLQKDKHDCLLSQFHPYNAGSSIQANVSQCDPVSGKAQQPAQKKIVKYRELQQL